MSTGFVFSAALVFLKAKKTLDISIWLCLAPLFAVSGLIAVIIVCMLLFSFKLVKNQSNMEEDLETLKKIYSQIGEKRNG